MAKLFLKSGGKDTVSLLEKKSLLLYSSVKETCKYLYLKSKLKTFKHILTPKFWCPFSPSLFLLSPIL